MTLTVVPISKTDARIFVNEHHRHNEAPTPQQVSFVAAMALDGVVIAVVTAGHPVARGLDDGFTLEVSRICVKPGVEVTHNINSRLYGVMRRVGHALGYRRMVTYTLQSEPGTSLKAAGFGEPIDIGIRSWANDSKVRVRHDVNLWGERNNAAEVAKWRWEMAL